MSEEGMEQKYVKEAFDTNWVVPLGPNVNGFEKDLEEFVNHAGSDPSTIRPFDRLRDRKAQGTTLRRAQGPRSGWWRCRRGRRRCIWDCWRLA